VCEHGANVPQRQTKQKKRRKKPKREKKRMKKPGPDHGANVPQRQPKKKKQTKKPKRKKKKTMKEKQKYKKMKGLSHHHFPNPFHSLSLLFPLSCALIFPSCDLCCYLLLRLSPSPFL
jgi:hypothetical protein